MKAQWKVPDNRPSRRLRTDHHLYKAKDFATEITIFNARRAPLTIEPAISREHITNNEAVRTHAALTRHPPRNVCRAAEDVKKVEASPCLGREEIAAKPRTSRRLINHGQETPPQKPSKRSSTTRPSGKTFLRPSISPCSSNGAAEPDPRGLRAPQQRPRSPARLARQGRAGLERPRRPRPAALHPGESPPQGADRRPAAADERSKTAQAPGSTPTSSPISTASPRARTRPSSTSTTRTGPTA